MHVLPTTVSCFWSCLFYGSGHESVACTSYYLAGLSRAELALGNQRLDVSLA